MDELLKKFLSYHSYKIISKTHFTPDVDFTLLDIDDAKYVLVETDVVDKIHERNGIEEALGVKFRDWVQPKEKKIVAIWDSQIDDFVDAVDIAVSEGIIYYTLALVQ
jgi:hypothetical protein